MKKKTKNNRGGAREGAGRKPMGETTRRKSSVTIDSQIYRYYQSQDKTFSILAEDSIRDSKDFKRWVRTQIGYKDA
mgnify:CR=1 FL=1|tara:strand:- start:139 stop:366 length:228 start_codon:yes stop_codon:yes gene_type:complete